jgi:hypothetical protein
MTPQHTAHYDHQESTSYSDLLEDSLQLEGSAPHLYLYQPIEVSESTPSAHGEPLGGVGSECCDQETLTWNPRYTSMNYALARLAHAS